MGLKSKGINGLILDLRNNGGGSLKTVVDITGFFIEKGPVVQVKSIGGRKEILRDNDPSVIWDGPLIVLVNEFLDEMTNIILANGGMVDKFMGDCIMAVYGAPIDMPNHAEMAVKSAIEIEAKTKELKQRYKDRGLPDINVGTGVNTGTAIIGNMGSTTRFDFSVIGDAVNLAARLEATAGHQ